MCILRVLSVMFSTTGSRLTAILPSCTPLVSGPGVFTYSTLCPAPAEAEAGSASISGFLIVIVKCRVSSCVAAELFTWG